MIGSFHVTDRQTNAGQNTTSSAEITDIFYSTALRAAMVQVFVILGLLTMSKRHILQAGATHDATSKVNVKNRRRHNTSFTLTVSSDLVLNYANTKEQLDKHHSTLRILRSKLYSIMCKN